MIVIKPFQASGWLCTYEQDTPARIPIIYPKKTFSLEVPSSSCLFFLTEILILGYY